MDWSTMTLGDLMTRFDAVLICATAGAERLEPLIAAAGGRVVRQLDWTETSALAELASRVVIVADMRGADVAEAALDRIGQHCGYTSSPVVLVLDATQIDLAAALLGHAAQLLCDPTDIELVAAVAVAGGRTTPVWDSAGEGEAARLRRLNDEVARIAEALSRLTGRDVPPSSANDFHLGFDAGPSAVTIEPAEIRRSIRARRLRDRQFGQGLFEDPAWDMLLDLFAAELERGQVSVSSLCVAAAVAPTTALRWIGRLVDAGLFRREPDPFDRRRSFIGLSERASAGMRSYVAAVRAAGLPIA